MYWVQIVFVLLVNVWVFTYKLWGCQIIVPFVINISYWIINDWHVHLFFLILPDHCKVSGVLVEYYLFYSLDVYLYLVCTWLNLIWLHRICSLSINWFNYVFYVVNNILLRWLLLLFVRTILGFIIILKYFHVFEVIISLHLCFDLLFYFKLFLYKVFIKELEIVVFSIIFLVENSDLRITIVIILVNFEAWFRWRISIIHIVFEIIRRFRHRIDDCLTPDRCVVICIWCHPVWGRTALNIGLVNQCTVPKIFFSCCRWLAWLA